MLSDSAIQGVVVPGNKKVLSLSKELSIHEFNCLPIRAPTVPKGKVRLRIVLHSFNTEEQVTTLCDKIHYHIQSKSKM